MMYVASRRDFTAVKICNSYTYTRCTVITWHVTAIPASGIQTPPKTSTSMCSITANEEKKRQDTTRQEAPDQTKPQPPAITTTENYHRHTHESQPPSASH